MGLLYQHGHDIKGVVCEEGFVLEFSSEVREDNSTPRAESEVRIVTLGYFVSPCSEFAAIGIGSLNIHSIHPPQTHRL